jgi:hypothetical protein
MLPHKLLICLALSPQVASWVGPKPRLLVMNRLDMVSSEDKKAWAQYYKDTKQQVSKQKESDSRGWEGSSEPHMLEQGRQLCSSIATQQSHRHVTLVMFIHLLSSSMNMPCNRLTWKPLSAGILDRWQGRRWCSRGQGRPAGSCR